jgi:hypothetical protein
VWRKSKKSENGGVEIWIDVESEKIKDIWLSVILWVRMPAMRKSCSLYTSGTRYFSPLCLHFLLLASNSTADISVRWVLTQDFAQAIRLLECSEVRSPIHWATKKNHTWLLTPHIPLATSVFLSGPASPASILKACANGGPARPEPKAGLHVI